MSMKLFLIKTTLIFGIAVLHCFALNGTIHEESFTGSISGDNILYNIYLPEGYETSTDRYPVIYHLHGLGGTQGGNQNQIVPELFEDALAQNIIGPVIIVFPNGHNNSMWGNSKDGTKPAENHVIQELLPHVDKEYRTYPIRGSRVVEGFSMGGFGALEYAAKFPELFISCVVYDGALHTWSTLSANQQQIADQVFGDDGDYFQDYSPWFNLAKNKQVLIDSMPVRLAVGALKDYNQPMRDTLQSYGINFLYVQTICDHNLGCLLDEEGINNVSFIAEYLDTSSGNTSVEPLCLPSSGFKVKISTHMKSGALCITITGIPGEKYLTLYDARGKVLHRGKSVEDRILLSGISRRAGGVFFIRIEREHRAFYKSVFVHQ